MREVAGFEVGTYVLLSCPVLRMTTGPHNLPRSRPITGLNAGLAAKASRAGRLQVADATAVVDEMNAELDRLRGTSVTTAERLGAAHPEPRAIGWHDDE